MPKTPEGQKPNSLSNVHGKRGQDRSGSRESLSIATAGLPRFPSPEDGTLVNHCRRQICRATI